MLGYLGLFAVAIVLLALAFAGPPKYTIERICADGTQIVRWQNDGLSTRDLVPVASVDVCSTTAVRQ